MAEEILSDDELEFIHSLMAASSAAPVARGPLTFMVDGGEQSNSLLLQLARSANLAFEAQFEDYCMSFPVQLTEDEFHALQMKLGPPIIYERGEVLRTWRLHLEQPLPLLKSDGGESALRVHELSSDGLLVGSRSKRKTPEQFHLRLALPDGNTMPVDARRIRTVQGGMTAYEVDFPFEEDAERIRHFLFKQHRRQHPELRPEKPGNLV